MMKYETGLKDYVEEIKNEMRGFLHQNDAKWLTTIN